MRPILGVLVWSGLLAAADGNFMACPNDPAVPVRIVSVRSLSPSLQADNFMITVNRLSQKLCGFSHVRMPVSIGILLDTSGSMRANGRLAVALSALDQLLSLSGPQDEYFLVEAADTASVRVGFTSDLSLIRSALRAGPLGRTALVDGLSVALNEMSTARHQTRALIVVSDGGDNESAHRLEKLTADVSTGHVAVFLLDPTGAIPPQPRLSEDEMELRRRLVQFAESSGGYLVNAINEERLRLAAADLSIAIHSPYTLSYVDRSGATRDRALRIEVTGVKPRPRLYYNSR